jgi:hypothetical protein
MEPEHQFIEALQHAQIRKKLRKQTQVRLCYIEKKIIGNRDTRLSSMVIDYRRVGDHTDVTLLQHSTPIGRGIDLTVVYMSVTYNHSQH